MSFYPEDLMIIDDQMRALDRPTPPVMSWLSGGLKGDFNERTKAWEQQVAAWEAANHDRAITWLELSERYQQAEAAHEEHKFDDTEWQFQSLLRAGCPERHVSLVRGRLEDKSTLRAIRTWAADGSRWSFVSCGGTGSGKSTAAAWALHQFSSRRFWPRWVSCPAVAESRLWSPEGELLRKRCRDAGILVLDDLGSGAREADAKPWLAWLDDVLDARWANKRKTVVTSNRTPDQLAAWLGVRMADRLNEGVIHVTADKSMRGTP